jgi:uncharacterized protein (DUF2236 family)
MTQPTPPNCHFDDTSMLRRVHREQVMVLAGGRALLLMAAHPVVFEGFFAATAAKGDPFARLERTAVVLETISYGDKADADRATAFVRRMHRSAKGTLPRAAGRFPKGTPYSAADPELLFWVWGSLVDSCLLVYERYVAPLSDAERQAYWEDQRFVGKQFGIPLKAMPKRVEELPDYVAAMVDSGDLHVTADALDTAKNVIFKPPIPASLFPLREAINQTSVGLLPAAVRDLYGFSWDPVRSVAVRAGQEYLRRLVVPLAPSVIRHTPQWRAHQSALSSS